MSWWAKTVEVLTGGLGSKIGDVIDQAVADKDLASRLKHELSMATLMSSAELQTARITAEKEVAVAVEQTHQAALNQSDIYTKRTRPKIARQAWGLGIVYGAATLAAPFVQPLLGSEVAIPAFDPAVFGTMVSPSLWYMGMRSVDKFKQG